MIALPVVQHAGEHHPAARRKLRRYVIDGFLPVLGRQVAEDFQAQNAVEFVIPLDVRKLADAKVEIGKRLAAPFDRRRRDVHAGDLVRLVLLPQLAGEIA